MLGPSNTNRVRISVVNGLNNAAYIEVDYGDGGRRKEERGSGVARYLVTTNPTWRTDTILKVENTQ